MTRPALRRPPAPRRAQSGVVLFIALIVIWVVTASALRAPPLTLLGKHRAKPAIPFLSALAMLGYGLAGAVSADCVFGVSRATTTAASAVFRRCSRSAMRFS